MEVKAGYKQTEVGIIPDDWQVMTLSKVSRMKSGESITEANIDQFSKYPCYGGNGLRGFTSQFTHDGEYALIGRQGALCGNVLGVRGKFFASEHAIVVTPFEQTDIHWLTCVLEDMNLNQYSESSAQPGLSVAKILNLTLAVPPTEPEQEAIAEALSDADALIEALEQLITKKHQVKQGAMQELLTGKKRLPGFTEKSVTESLGTICEIEKGEQLNRDTLSVIDDYPVWNGGVEPSGFTGKWNTEAETLTVSEGGNSCGFVNFIHQRFWRGGHCYALNNIDPGISQDYLYQFLKCHEKDIMALRVGSGLPNIQRGSLSGFIVWLPSLEDQSAIAEILSDMDAEIAALEAKLVKARQVKQGMMQELLTGKIRLAIK